MESDRSEVPWPNYRQWVLSMASFGCIGFVLSLISPIALALYDVMQARIAHTRPAPRHHLGFPHVIGITLACVFVPMTLTHSVLFAINGVIRMRWWIRIGRLTTWKQIQQIPTEERSAYEILVKPIFLGSTSFGTYQTVGGWPALLLRHRSTGRLWVLRGKVPAEIEGQGMEVVSV